MKGKTMSVYSQIAGLARTIEYGYPDAVTCLTRDRELLRQFKSDPDARSSYRQSQKLVDDWRSELAELAELVFRHLPQTAARLRIVSPVTGTVSGRVDDVDGLVQELRTIQVGAAQADAGPVVTTPTATEPDQDLTDDEYLPAKDVLKVLPDQFSGYNALRRHCEKKDVPIRKPAGNRLEIHAAKLLASLVSGDDQDNKELVGVVERYAKFREERDRLAGK